MESKTEKPVKVVRSINQSATLIGLTGLIGFSSSASEIGRRAYREQLSDRVRPASVRCVFPARISA
jgi:hypothetical protein